jgi:enediyne biosynthesis protein E4
MSRIIPIVLLLLCSALLPAQTTSRPAFENGTKTSGLDRFVLVSGTPQKRYIVEAMGGGLCLLDYDGDGFLDIYLVNGGQTDRFKKGEPSGLKNALFRNNGDGTFRDVTDVAGVGGNGSWGFGCSVADYDNDGRSDLFVTTFDRNLLYHNLGNGRFEEVATKAGIAHAQWSTGSAWADYNGDGWLDLFVTNYARLDPARLPEPGAEGYGSMAGGGGCRYRGVPVMCGPRGLPGSGDFLYRNNGDGTFTEVTKQAGMQGPENYYGLGAIWCDFDDDGRPDLFVANDSTPNYLYRNKGDGTFEERGFLSGVAVSGQGQEQASMGVACGDYERRGRLGLYVTNFSDDVNTLYRNDGKLNFLDVTAQAGLVTATLPQVAWGTFFFDFDNDGLLDLFVANGHVYPDVDQLPGPTRYREPNQLFRNLGGGRFELVVAAALGVPPAVSRGACYGDFDNDGRLDVLVSNLDGAPTLLWNRTQPRQNFLTLTLIGSRSNRDALGARVRVRTGTQWQMQEKRSGESYLSSCDPRLHFGLGKAAKADYVEVRWPRGPISVLRNVLANQFLTVREPAQSAEGPGQPAR